MGWVSKDHLYWLVCHMGGVAIQTLSSRERRVGSKSSSNRPLTITWWPCGHLFSIEGTPKILKQQKRLAVKSADVYLKKLRVVWLIKQLEITNKYEMSKQRPLVLAALCHVRGVATQGQTLIGYQLSRDDHANCLWDVTQNNEILAITSLWTLILDLIITVLLENSQLAPRCPKKITFRTLILVFKPLSWPTYRNNCMALVVRLL